MKNLESDSRVCALVFLLTISGLTILMLVTGCAVSKEVTLRNPTIMKAQDWVITDSDELNLTTHPEIVPNFPPGYFDTSDVRTARGEAQPVYRVSGESSNRIKTIYYDSTKAVSPAAYFWNGNELNVMLTREYRFGSFSLPLNRVDSLVIVIPDSEKRRIPRAVIAAAALGGFVLYMTRTVD